MARFHRLKVAEITRETADCVSVVFDVPANVKEEFKYIQGQYLTLKLTVNGEELRRSYSLCTSPVADRELRVAVKKVKDGRASTFINDSLKAGDEMDVMTPMGNFHSPLSPTNKKNYVLFAGGSGITPMLSIIKTVLQSEPESKIILFYGNRDEAAIIFKKQLDTLAAANTERLKVHHILEHCGEDVDELCRGILMPDKVKSLVAKHVNLNADNMFFICGPGPMMENVKVVLADLKVDVKKILIEYFTAVEAAVKAAEEQSAVKEIIQSKVTVILDGEEVEFDLASNGKPILNVALDAGMDVPFACQGGVCCTCRAKLMEGKVTMDHNFALSQEELDNGYILTCQSHPVTEKVVVDFDQP
ncbi:MAG: FAD-binding oxidoreductase [Bacteroidota bacterium]|nr:FAD-binding oxidoreductase [Bacteroidota bacterium]